MTTAADTSPPEAQRPDRSESRFAHATAKSRDDRGTSLDALEALEHALGSPTPSRERSWLADVVGALDIFLEALVDQAESDLGPDSLLSEIGRDQPRLVPRIQRLHLEHRDLRDMATSLRRQIHGGDSADDIDTADIRDRLADLARRYRRHRAREADLVYESVTIDLGVGD